MPESTVSFRVRGMTLRGNLHIPSSGAPCVVLCHGLEAHKDTEKWRTFAHRLAGAGFAVLRFNFPRRVRCQGTPTLSLFGISPSHRLGRFLVWLFYRS